MNKGTVLFSELSNFKFFNNFFNNLRTYIESDDYNLRMNQTTIRELEKLKEFYASNNKILSKFGDQTNKKYKI